MFGKRGMSTLVVMVILIALVLGATATVWVVIRNLIGEGTEGVSFEKFAISLEIKGASVQESNVNVNLKRNPGKGELVKVKFIFSDGTTAESSTKTTTMEELEEESFVIALTQLASSNLKSVSIAPVFKSSSGEEVTADIIDTYIFSGASSGGEEQPGGEGFCRDNFVQSPNGENFEEECDRGLNCLSDCTCEIGYVPTTPRSKDCQVNPEVVCNGFFDSENEQCDGGGNCQADCTCPSDYEPDGIGGCAQITALNTGTVGNIWPPGASKYFDSDNLPKSLTVSSYNGNYIKFSGAETRCLQITWAEYLSTESYDRSYLRLEDIAQISSGDNYEIWESATCGV